MHFIETRDLTQARENRYLLKNVNMRIERGEVFALIGPTGAGKTTLLRLLDLLDRPQDGKIFFDGIDVTDSESIRLGIRRRMGFVLQKPIVFNASVYDNVAIGLKWRRLGKNQVSEMVEHTLEMVGLADYRTRNARTLSGGEMQRVAIARAIATGPEVLLLDEPTANLDPVSSGRIEDLITGIIKRETITVIMATHDMAQGQRMSDRIGVLMNGEMLQTGQSWDIFNSPRNRLVAEFVGMENILKGKVIRNDGDLANIDIAGKTIEAVTGFTEGEEISIGIRPEDITLNLTQVASSARNSLAGEVTGITSNGPLCRIEIDCGFPLVALVTRRSTGELELEKGKRVYANFKATVIHVFRN